MKRVPWEYLTIQARESRILSCGLMAFWVQSSKEKMGHASALMGYSDQSYIHGIHESQPKGTVADPGIVRMCVLVL
ncbi:hypothetical protein PAXRUDRAFT_631183 [Paxillus rubicundulus Ve08.2h10]|uniref:Uncharacterized protein n=1 Tax=Paxillus rubicundulus Ve08.2h10 TaxID=930991 RepID=A0A0D0D4G7_9AGAM|nr:hypothetical protein PAXRUDRAFT_631183 [Paxillus rubicundulus Ve08.2h10]